MTRNRFDGGNHFFVGHFLRGAGKAGIAPIHENGAIALGIASQRSNQLPSVRVAERTEIHTTFSFQKKAEAKIS
jgi:hypothetical protein